jgi:hypothetical protein
MSHELKMLQDAHDSAYDILRFHVEEVAGDSVYLFIERQEAYADYRKATDKLARYLMDNPK